MKKFVFSMQKMHDYKKQILESEKNILMSLRREKNEYEQRLDTLACNMDALSNKSQKEIARYNGFKAYVLQYADGRNKT